MNSLVDEKLIRERARFINSNGEKCKILEIEGNLVIYEKCKDKDKHNAYYTIGKDSIRKNWTALYKGFK